MEILFTKKSNEVYATSNNQLVFTSKNVHVGSKFTELYFELLCVVVELGLSTTGKDVD